MSQCVICGITLPEGYGQVCLRCRSKYGQREDLSQVENENRRLQMLLTMERREHAATRRKLEKADHDRQRYARRIRFLDGRHDALCALYRATKKERDILETALNACERSLFEWQPDPQKKMQTEDSISQSVNTTPRESCSASSAHSTKTQSSLSGASEKSPEAGGI